MPSDRSPHWIADYGAHVGGTVFLDMPEMGVEGLADVITINPAPEVEPLLEGCDPSEYRLVTGTFKHTSGEVYDLKLASESKPIGVTATHPFWSMDRNAWVSAIDLEIGETLKTLVGTTVVESLARRPGSEPVYNIEVEGDHVYRVGESGVLVHNASCPATRDTKALTSSLGASTLPANVPPQAHHILPVSEFNTPLGKKLCCWGIDLNSSENGVWLPYCDYPGRQAVVHRGSNTQKYIDDVVAEVGVAKNKADAIAILSDIKSRLLDGSLKISNADETKPC